LVLVLMLAFAGTAYAAVTQTEGESISPSAFTGPWMVYSEPPLSKGSGIYSYTANSTLTFPFTGDGITWIAAIAPTCGQAQVWVDGQAPQTISLNIATPAEYLKTVWTWSGSNGSHVLHINVVGNGNVNVDRLDVNAPAPVVSTPASSPWTLALMAILGLGIAAFAGTMGQRTSSTNPRTE
jgi:hypothetical protein